MTQENQLTKNLPITNPNLQSRHRRQRVIRNLKSPAPPELIEITNAHLTYHFHPGQVRAWVSPARFVAVLAGTQGGKTSFGPHWLYREIKNSGPGDYLIVTPTFQLLEKKLLPEFLHTFRRLYRLGRYTASPSRVFTFSDAGCRRAFGDRWDPSNDPPTRVLFGYAEDPESLESATCKAAWLDEAGQKKFRLGSWEAVLRRLSLHMGRVLITTTIYSLGWLKQKIYDPWLAGDPTIEVISFDSIANPRFPRAEYERAQHDLPRWKFEMLYRAQFTRPAGLIYDCFDRAAHTCKRFAIPPHWPRFVGLDFGGVNMAAVFYAREPATGRLYLYRTYHRGGLSVSGHVRQLLHGESTRAALRAVGGAPSENDWRREFAANGLPVRAPRLSDVELGIDRVYGAHQRGEIIVFDDLSDYLEEKLTYSRVLDEKGNPTEEIEDKTTYHLLDAERYLIADLASPARTLRFARVDLYAPVRPIHHSPLPTPYRTDAEVEAILDAVDNNTPLPCSPHLRTGEGSKLSHGA